MRQFSWKRVAAALLERLRLAEANLGQLSEEFANLASVIRPFTMLSESRLISLYSLAKQICLGHVPGNFVECGTARGGAAALLAYVAKHYSQTPRRLFCFDTFEGMPEPADVDKHQGIPANLTPFGAGTLKAPLAENLENVCRQLDVCNFIVPVKGLFADTLPKSKELIGPISLLHADADWYASTMDIFENLYDLVVPGGFIQIDDYGHWEGCKKAIHDFERRRKTSFALEIIDNTGVWLRKGHS
jgi:predicted O-methyltransferase YrrM